MNILKPKEIAEVFNKSAFEKNSYTTGRLITLAVIGGAFIAFGFMLAILVTGGAPELRASNPGLGKFLLGAIFPVGFIMCVIGGGEIFTSACAVMPMPILRGQTGFKPLLRVWGLIYLGNIVGGILVAWLFTKQTGIFPQGSETLDYLLSIAEHKVGNPFITTVIKGMGANWMVCMAAWMAYSAKDTISRIIAIWIPVMIFVTFGFEHCVANMYVIPAAIFHGGTITWGHFIFTNLIPATIGNILGGFIFVGLAYWFIYLKGKEV